MTWRQKIWRVTFRPSAQRQLDTLDAGTAGLVRRALLRLAVDPSDASGTTAMQGGGYRLRLGDWRVVYALEDDKLLVMALRTGNRRDTYR
jgi:mRNA interferase RelE/StbE